MIELQTALLIAGFVVFVVVAIVSYDRYRSGKRRDEPANLRSGADSAPDTEDTDATMPARRAPWAGLFDRKAEPAPRGEFRHEPQLDSLAADEEEAVVVQSSRGRKGGAAIDQQLSLEITAAEQDELPRAVSADPAQTTGDGFVYDDYDPDEKLPIELVARIPGSNAIKRDTALGIYRQFEFDIKKQHRIFGLLNPGGTWCDLEKQTESAQFTDFGVCVQLADRHGPITESELNRFSQMILRFAEVFGRRFRFSISLNDALEYAQKLDAFCNKYDAVAILNVVSRDHAFRGSDIHRCAREMGMMLNQRSIYEKRQPNVQAGELLYSLASLQHDGQLPETGKDDFVTNGVTLFMNIPRSANPAQVFNDMVTDAKDICKRLDGKLVDQNLRGMNQKGLKRISQHIRQINHEMESEGILPGSEKTLRLF